MTDRVAGSAVSAPAAAPRPPGSSQLDDALHGVDVNKAVADMASRQPLDPQSQQNVDRFIAAMQMKLQQGSDKFAKDTLREQTVAQQMQQIDKDLDLARRQGEIGSTVVAADEAAQTAAAGTKVWCGALGPAGAPCVGMATSFQAGHSFGEAAASLTKNTAAAGWISGQADKVLGTGEDSAGSRMRALNGPPSSSPPGGPPSATTDAASQGEASAQAEAHTGTGESGESHGVGAQLNELAKQHNETVEHTEPVFQTVEAYKGAKEATDLARGYSNIAGGESAENLEAVGRFGAALAAPADLYKAKEAYKAGDNYGVASNLAKATGDIATVAGQSGVAGAAGIAQHGINFAGAVSSGYEASQIHNAMSDTLRQRLTEATEKRTELADAEQYLRQHPEILKRYAPTPVAPLSRDVQLESGHGIPLNLDTSRLPLASQGPAQPVAPLSRDVQLESGRGIPLNLDTSRLPLASQGPAQ